MVTFEDNNLIVKFVPDAMKRIEEEALSAFPHETGGFLVGRYVSNESALVQMTVSPANKESSPCSFIRSTVGMEGLWDLLHTQGLIYLGEWHSHPNGTSQYSCTDYRAIKEINESESVHIKQPMLFIISLSRKGINEYSLYRFYDNKLLKFTNVD